MVDLRLIDETEEKAEETADHRGGVKHFVLFLLLTSEV